MKYAFQTGNPLPPCTPPVFCSYMPAHQLSTTLTDASCRTSLGLSRISTP